jgi:hypothetical protein
MNNHALRRNLVAPGQILRVSHLLAAANHRQWVRWEQWVLRDPSLLAQSVDAIRRAGGSDLNNDLANSAKAVVEIVRRAVGDFAYDPDMRTVVQRKQRQFDSWVKYAAGQQQARRERWLLQCRTPFLHLPPDMQASDYTEAARDLTIVARAGGLVLCSPLPDTTPMTPRQLRRQRMLHAIGVHGEYVDSEQPWSNICSGCHRSWSSGY